MNHQKRDEKLAFRAGKIMQALCRGIRVKIGPETFVVDDDYRICQQAHGMNGELILYKLNMTSQAFINVMVRRITDEEFSAVVSSIAETTTRGDGSDV